MRGTVEEVGPQRRRPRIAARGAHGLLIPQPASSGAEAARAEPGKASWRSEPGVPHLAHAPPGKRSCETAGTERPHVIVDMKPSIADGAVRPGGREVLRVWHRRPEPSARDSNHLARRSAKGRMREVFEQLRRKDEVEAEVLEGQALGARPLTARVVTWRSAVVERSTPVVSSRCTSTLVMAPSPHPTSRTLLTPSGIISSMTLVFSTTSG